MLWPVLIGLLTGLWLAKRRWLQAPRERALLLASFPLYHLAFATADFYHGGSLALIGHELLATAVFWLLAWCSINKPVVLPASVLAHGIYDLVLASTAAPWWWGGFCGAVDVLLALLWWPGFRQRLTH